MPMRVLEVELSVQALQIGEILRMFKRTITSIFESRYLRNKYLQTRNSADLGLLEHATVFLKSCSQNTHSCKGTKN